MNIVNQSKIEMVLSLTVNPDLNQKLTSGLNSLEKPYSVGLLI